MIDEKYLELIHRKIDGDITEDEKDQLFRFLKTNPEAEQLYNDLLEMSKDLGGLEEIDGIGPIQSRLHTVLGS